MSLYLEACLSVLYDNLLFSCPYFYFYSLWSRDFYGVDGVGWGWGWRCEVVACLGLNQYLPLFFLLCSHGLCFFPFLFRYKVIIEASTEFTIILNCGSPFSRCILGLVYRKQKRFPFFICLCVWVIYLVNSSILKTVAPTPKVMDTLRASCLYDVHLAIICKINWMSRIHSSFWNGCITILVRCFPQLLVSIYSSFKFQ